MTDHDELQAKTLAVIRIITPGAQPGDYPDTEAEITELFASVSPPLTRERVAAAVRELQNQGHSFMWLGDELTDRLCRLLGVTEGE
jgi:hypothetical protein